jgi:Mrp family chromosome partitioning ATPase
MSDQCNQSCNSCGETCDSRQEKQDLREAPHHLSSIKKVIGVVSGKGGVGKSLVTSMLAVTMSRRGFRSAILDADITGPTIPKTFGIRDKAVATDAGIFPITSKMGVDIMSVNLLLDHDTDPVVWRGPMIAGMVKQFWTDVIWTDVDYMFVDMPPGTGDVPLTVFQSLHLDGIVIVTSPQDLVSMVVTKAVKMAQMMDVPIYGIVENMAYFKCDACDKEHSIFGVSGIDKISKEFNIPVIGRLPIDAQIASICDKGLIELFEGDWLDKAADHFEA